ncbi:MAG: AAA family ATPase [Candidatus Omnitrophota bacterium]|nr:AAA family ATPase [Candidatus Omnitrophota bacterium]
METERLAEEARKAEQAAIDALKPEAALKKPIKKTIEQMLKDLIDNIPVENSNIWDTLNKMYPFPSRDAKADIRKILLGLAGDETLSALIKGLHDNLSNGGVLKEKDMLSKEEYEQFKVQSGLKKDFDRPPSEIKNGLPFTYSNMSYQLVLAPRDILDMIGGYISADCTDPGFMSGSSFLKYVLSHIRSPGFLKFRLYRQTKENEWEWVGNVYTAVAKDKNNHPIFLIDALQLPSKDAGPFHTEPSPNKGNLPFKNLQEAATVAEQAVETLINYAQEAGFKEVWLGFISNFYEPKGGGLVEHFQTKYADAFNANLAPTMGKETRSAQIKPTDAGNYESKLSELGIELLGIPRHKLDSFNYRRGFAKIWSKPEIPVLPPPVQLPKALIGAMIFDLDNTLSRTTQLVPDEIIEKLIEFLKQNVQIAIVTAQSKEEVEEYLIAPLKKTITDKGGSMGSLDNLFIYTSLGSQGWRLDEKGQFQSTYDRTKDTPFESDQEKGLLTIIGKIVDTEQILGPVIRDKHEGKYIHNRIASLTIGGVDKEKRIDIATKLRQGLSSLKVDIKISGSKTIHIVPKDVDKSVAVKHFRDGVLKSRMGDQIKDENILVIGDDFKESDGFAQGLDLDLIVLDANNYSVGTKDNLPQNVQFYPDGEKGWQRALNLFLAIKIFEKLQVALPFAHPYKDSLIQVLKDSQLKKAIEESLMMRRKLKAEEDEQLVVEYRGQPIYKIAYNKEQKRWCVTRFKIKREKYKSPEMNYKKIEETYREPIIIREWVATHKTAEETRGVVKEKIIGEGEDPVEWLDSTPILDLSNTNVRRKVKGEFIDVPLYETVDADSKNPTTAIGGIVLQDKTTKKFEASKFKYRIILLPWDKDDTDKYLAVPEVYTGNGEYMRERKLAYSPDRSNDGRLPVMAILWKESLFPLLDKYKDREFILRWKYQPIDEEPSFGYAEEKEIVNSSTIERIKISPYYLLLTNTAVKLFEIKISGNGKISYDNIKAIDRTELLEEWKDKLLEIVGVKIKQPLKPTPELAQPPHPPKSIFPEKATMETTVRPKPIMTEEEIRISIENFWRKGNKDYDKFLTKFENLEKIDDSILNALTCLLLDDRYRYTIHLILSLENIRSSAVKYLENLYLELKNRENRKDAYLIGEALDILGSPVGIHSNMDYLLTMLYERLGIISSVFQHGPENYGYLISQENRLFMEAWRDGLESIVKTDFARDNAIRKKIDEMIGGLAAHGAKIFPYIIERVKNINQELEKTKNESLHPDHDKAQIAINWCLKQQIGLLKEVIERTGAYGTLLQLLELISNEEFKQAARIGIESAISNLIKEDEINGSGEKFWKLFRGKNAPSIKRVKEIVTNVLIERTPDSVDTLLWLFDMQLNDVQIDKIIQILKPLSLIVVPTIQNYVDSLKWWQPKRVLKKIIKVDYKKLAVQLINKLKEAPDKRHGLNQSKSNRGVNTFLMSIFIASSLLGLTYPTLAQEQVPEEHIVQTQPTQPEKKVELPTAPEKKAPEKTPAEKQKEAEEKIKQEKAEAEHQVQLKAEREEKERKDEETRIKREKDEEGQKRVDAEKSKSREETWESFKSGAVVVFKWIGVGLLFLLGVGLLIGVVKILEAINKNIKPIARGTAKAAVGTAKGTGFLIKHLVLSPYYFGKYVVYYPLKGLYMGSEFTIKAIEKRNVATEVISLILFLSALTGYVIYKATAYSTLINMPTPSTGDLIKMLEDPYRAIMWVVFGAAGILTSIGIVRYIARSKKNLPVSGVALSLIIVFSSIAGIANYPLASYLSKDRARVEAIEALSKSTDLTSPEVVDSLIEALSDRNADVRKHAAEALGNCGDKRAIKPLIRALDDSEASSSAASALDKLGVVKTTDDIELLKKLLKTNSYYGFKSEATAAFVRMGTSSIPVLIDMLSDDNSAFQEVANDALVSIAKENTRSVLNGLEKPLSNDKAGVRLRAVKIIIGMDNKQDTVGILTRISQQDRDWDIREKATSRLQDIKPDTKEAEVVKLISKKDEEGLVKAGAPAVGFLVSNLESSSGYSEREQREMSVKVLAKIGDKAAVEPIIKAMQDSKIESKVAVEALGQLKDSRAIEPLLKLKKDSDYSSDSEPGCDKIAEAIVQINGGNPTDALVKALGDDNKNTRRIAVKALAQSNNPEIIKPFIERLKDDDEEVVVTATRALGRLAAKDAVDPLVAIVKDENIRGDKLKAATEALTQIGQPAVMPLLKIADDKTVGERAQIIITRIGQGSVDSLVERLNHWNPSERKQAIELLAKIGKPAIPSLIQAFGSDAYSVREGALNALIQIRDTEASVDLLINGLQNQNSDIRWRSAAALIEMPHQKAVGSLIQCLNDTSPKVRKTVAQALGFYSGLEAVQALMQHLQDGDVFVRKAVVISLGRIGFGSQLRNEVTSAIIQKLDDTDWQVRAAAAKIIIASPGVENALVSHLEDPSPYVRRQVVLSLGRVSSSATYFDKALNDSDEYVRLTAIQATEQINPFSINISDNFVLKTLFDDNENVRAVAQKALKEKKDFQLSYRLLEILSDVSKSNNERAYALEAIKALDEFGAKVLIVGLESKNDAIRQVSAQALTKMGKTACGQLVENLRNEDVTTRQTIVNILIEIGDPAKKDLSKAIWAEDDPELSGLAKAVLYKIDYTSAQKIHQNLYFRYVTWPEIKKWTKVLAPLYFLILIGIGGLFGAIKYMREQKSKKKTSPILRRVTLTQKPIIVAEAIIKNGSEVELRVKSTYQTLITMREKKLLEKVLSELGASGNSQLIHKISKIKLVTGNDRLMHIDKNIHELVIDIDAFKSYYLLLMEIEHELQHILMGSLNQRAPPLVEELTILRHEIMRFLSFTTDQQEEVLSILKADNDLDDKKFYEILESAQQHDIEEVSSLLIKYVIRFYPKELRRGLPAKILTTLKQDIVSLWQDLHSKRIVSYLGTKYAIEPKIAKLMVRFHRKMMEEVRKRSIGEDKLEPYEFTLRELYKWAEFYKLFRNQWGITTSFIKGAIYIYADRMENQKDKNRFYHDINAMSLDLEALEAIDYKEGRKPDIATLLSKEQIIKDTVRDNKKIIDELGMGTNTSSDSEYIPSKQSAELVHIPRTVEDLEKISLAVKLNDPVLLIGETGVGKTSLVRDLAFLTKNAFRRFNLNGQTDKLEFIGGFKPKRKHSKQDKTGKREFKFEWYNGILIEAMQKGHWLVLDEINLAEPEVIERIRYLLEPKGYLKVSEHEGEQWIQDNDYNNLVNELVGEYADKHTETKEELIKKAVQKLSDKGIFRIHPNFRLFATMNPPEYEGRKQLSPALMNKFRVKWIRNFTHDEICKILEEKYQLSEDIINKLSNFYVELARISGKQGELGREIGQPYYFTIRQFFRLALRVRHWLSQFTTMPSEEVINQRLALESEEVYGDSLRTDADKKLFNKLLEKKEIFGYLPPQINTEIKMDESKKKVCFGEVELPINEKKGLFVPTSKAELASISSTRRNLRSLARSIQMRENILLVGPTGSAKTASLANIAYLTRNNFIRLNLDSQTDIGDLIGKNVPEEGTSGFRWQDGDLIKAMREGYWLLLDEFNLAEPEILERINSLLDDDGSLVVTEHEGEVWIPGNIYDEKKASGEDMSKFQRIHENFRLFAAMNPEHYAGRNRLSLAMKNKFIEKWFSGDFSSNEIKEIIRFYLTKENLFKGPPLPNKSIDAITEFMASVHLSILRMIKENRFNRLALSGNAEDYNFSLRELKDWAEFIRNLVMEVGEGVITKSIEDNRKKLNKLQRQLTIISDPIEREKHIQKLREEKLIPLEISFQRQKDENEKRKIEADIMELNKEINRLNDPREREQYKQELQVDMEKVKQSIASFEKIGNDNDTIWHWGINRAVFDGSLYIYCDRLYGLAARTKEHTSGDKDIFYVEILEPIFTQLIQTGIGGLEAIDVEKERQLLGEGISPDELIRGAKEEGMDVASQKLAVKFNDLTFNYPEELRGYLTKIFKDLTKPETQIQGIYGFALLPRKTALRLVDMALDHPNPKVKQAAMETLTQIFSERDENFANDFTPFTGKLAVFLSDENQDLRLTAALVLENLNWLEWKGIAIPRISEHPEKRPKSLPWDETLKRLIKLKDGTGDYLGIFGFMKSKLTLASMLLISSGAMILITPFILQASSFSIGIALIGALGYLSAIKIWRPIKKEDVSTHILAGCVALVLFTLPAVLGLYLNSSILALFAHLIVFLGTLGISIGMLDLLGLSYYLIYLPQLGILSMRYDRLALDLDDFYALLEKTKEGKFIHFPFESEEKVNYFNMWYGRATLLTGFVVGINFVISLFHTARIDSLPVIPFIGWIPPWLQISFGALVGGGLGYFVSSFTILAAGTFKEMLYKPLKAIRVDKIKEKDWIGFKELLSAYDSSIIEAFRKYRNRLLKSDEGIDDAEKESTGKNAILQTLRPDAIKRLDKGALVYTIFVPTSSLDAKETQVFIPEAENSELIPVVDTVKALKQIALSVLLDDPVLLVGETGVGKTSLVRYLANLTRHSFRRFNLSGQTDKTEFIGGYKPGATGMFQWKDGILVEAMLYGHWLVLDELNLAESQVLERLNSLLDDDRTLVLAEHSGEHFKTKTIYEEKKKEEAKEYFDEVRKVNYIVDKDGRRIYCIHPEFRLFATMNPAEYAGRKVLSPALMNRFRVKWIDDLTITEKKLVLLEKYYNQIEGDKEKHFIFGDGVLDRLGMLHERISTAAKSREIGRDSIDPYHYSIRDLLKLVRRAVSRVGLKENSIGVLLNSYEKQDIFVEELPEVYKDKIRDRDEEEFLGNIFINAAFKYSSKLAENLQIDQTNSAVNFGEIPLLKNTRGGPYIPGAEANLIHTPGTLRYLKRIAKTIIMNEKVLLVGPTGSAKTSLIRYLAYLTKNNFARMNLDAQTDTSELIGKHVPVENRKGEFKWQDGMLVEALKEGWWVLLDEVNLAEAEILERINSLLDDDACMVITEHENEKIISNAEYEKKLKPFIEEYINSGASQKEARQRAIKKLTEEKIFPIHPDFRLFAAMNPEHYAGRNRLSMAMRNKLTEIWIPGDMDIKELTEIVKGFLREYSQGAIKERDLESIANAMALFHTKLQEVFKKCAVFTTGYEFSIRELRVLARYISTFGPTIGIKEALRNGIAYTYIDRLHTKNFRFKDEKGEEKETNDRKLFIEILEGILKESIPLLDLGYLESYASGKIISEIKFGDKTINFGGVSIPINETNGSEYVPSEEVARLVLTPQTKSNLGKIIQSAILKEPLLLVGETGVGKTSFIRYLANKTHNNFRRFNLSGQTEKLEFIGGFKPDERGVFIWHKGILIEAMQKGHWLVLDEINLAPSQVIERLNSLLDDDEFLVITEHENEKWVQSEVYDKQKNRLLKSDPSAIKKDSDDTEYLLIKSAKLYRIHPDFRLFATMNPADAEYAGRKRFSPALMNRFRVKWIDEFHRDEPDVRQILQERYGKYLPNWLLEAALDVHFQMHEKGKELADGKIYYTIRHLMRWLGRVKEAGVKDENELRRIAALEAKEVYGDGLSDESSQKYLKMGRENADRVREKGLYDILKEKFGADFQDDDIQIGNKDGKVYFGNIGVPINGRQESYIPAYPLNLTYSTSRYLKKLAKAVLRNEPILLVGPTGGGKTAFVRQLADLVNMNFISLDLDGQTDVAELIGQFIPEEKTDKYKWHPGALLEALETGSWILIDELNLAEPEVLERINSLLDDDGILVVTEHENEVYMPARLYDAKVNKMKEELKKKDNLSEETAINVAQKKLKNQGFHCIKPNFRLFAAMNPESYAGRTRLSLAMLNKFSLLWVPGDQPESEQISIVGHYLSVPAKRQESIKIPEEILHEAVPSKVAVTQAVKPEEAKESISMSEKEVKLIFDKAEEYKENKDYHNAEKLYSEVINQAEIQHKESEWWFYKHAYSTRALVRKYSKKFDEAMSDYLKAITLNHGMSIVWMGVKDLLDIVSNPVRQKAIIIIKNADLSKDAYGLAFQARCLLDSAKFTDGPLRKLLLEKSLACCDAMSDDTIKVSMEVQEAQEELKKIDNQGNTTIGSEGDGSSSVSFVNYGRYMGMISNGSFAEKKVNFATEQKSSSEATSSTDSQESSWLGKLNHWNKLRRINSAMRKIELTAKFFGGDFNVKLMPHPGNEWGITYDTDPPTIMFPEKDLMEKSCRHNVATAMHEGGHRDITWIDPEFNKSESTRFLFNAVEDPRVNNWIMAKFRGAGDYFGDLYKETFPIVQKQPFNDSVVLPHIQYGLGLIHYWFYGKEHPAIKNKRVLDALQRTRENVINAYETLPGTISVKKERGERITVSSPIFKPMPVDLPPIGQRQYLGQPDISAIQRIDEDRIVLTTARGHKEIVHLSDGKTCQVVINISPSAEEKINAAQDAAWIIKHKILPIYETLVEESKNVAKQGVGQKGGSGMSSQEREGKAEQEVEQKSKEAADALGRKFPIDEELEKTVSQDKSRGGSPENKEKEEKEQGGKDISNKDAKKQTGQGKEVKIGQEKESPSKQSEEEERQDVAKGKTAEEEQGKESRERPKVVSEDEESLTTQKQIDLAAKLEHDIKRKLTRYDEYYLPMAHLIEQLFGVLDNELHKDIKPKYKGDFATGTKLNLRKAMQMEHTADTDIWLRRVKPAKRSFKFALVLDESGSMGSPDKTINAMHSLVLLQEVLSRLEIDFSVIGFSDRAWTHKGFGKKFRYENKDDLISEVLSYMQRGQSTNDAEGVELATKQLENQDGDSKIAIVITDGQGNGPERVANYLEKARKKHIEVIGIGIGYAMGYVKGVYRPYILVNEVDDLPKVLAKVLIDIIVHQKPTSEVGVNGLSTIPDIKNDNSTPTNFMTEQGTGIKTGVSKLSEHLPPNANGFVVPELLAVLSGITLLILGMPFVLSHISSILIGGSILGASLVIIKYIKDTIQSHRELSDIDKSAEQGRAILEKNKKHIEKEVGKLTKELQAIEKEISSVMEEKAGIDKKIDGLKASEQQTTEEAKINAIKDEIGALESQGKEIQQKLGSLITSKKSNEDKIARLRQDIYRIEQQKPQGAGINEAEAYATSLVNSVVVRAREAKKLGQKLIIGFDTSWIPGYEKGKLEHMALNPLVREIEKLEQRLSDLGLDNVIIVNKSGDELANELISSAEKTNTPLSNVVALASQSTISSKAFDNLRSTKDEKKAFIAAINTDEFDKYCMEHPEDSDRLYVRIVEMLSIALELSIGKEPPNNPLIILYDQETRIVVFMPKAEPVDFKELKNRYDAERQAIIAA